MILSMEFEVVASGDVWLRFRIVFLLLFWPPPVFSSLVTRLILELVEFIKLFFSLMEEAWRYR